MNYHSALNSALDAASTSTEFSNMTKEGLERAIADISEVMKGPMPNHERIFHAATRRALRAELERRTPA